jgi:hypothetical protein
LAWAPPELRQPQEITVSADGGAWVLPRDRDCLIDLPDTRAVTRPVIVRGCRNVVLIGGEVDHDGRLRPGDLTGIGIWLDGWTGTAHVEGVRLGGSGLSDALWLSSPHAGSTAQVENVRVDHVQGAYDIPLARCAPPPPDPHPDLIQLFQGPERLRIDRFTGYTTYQGIFDDSGEKTPRRILRELTVSRSNVELTGGGCSAAAVVPGSVTERAGSPTRLDRFWVEDNGRGSPALIPSRAAEPSWWGNARRGRPPGGDFVTAGDAGLEYESPGYGG